MNTSNLVSTVLARRAPLLKSRNDTAYRLLHGEGDGAAGLFVDRFGEVLVAQVHEGRCELPESALREICEELCRVVGTTAVYRKVFPKDRSGGTERELDAAHRDATPWIGAPVGDAVVAIENGLRFEIRPYDGFSVGLFCEQRLNRKRVRELLAPPRGDAPVGAGGPVEASSAGETPAATTYEPQVATTDAGEQRVPVENSAAGETPAATSAARVLNLFAYTCGFSIAAAAAGATTVSVDVSKRFLEWGKRNFGLNGIGLANHRFFADDVMEYFRRANKKLERFDFIVCDPPTFARAREGGRVFALPDAWPALLSGCVSLLAPAGHLLVCTNHRATSKKNLESLVQDAAGRRRCRVVMRPGLPIDFPGDGDFSKSIFVQLDA